MKNPKQKLLVALGLSACLALPGMAMADGGNRFAYRDYDRSAQHRDDRRDHDRYHFDRWDRREFRHERWERHEAREWRNIYLKAGPRGPGFYRMRPARYGGIYWTGVYFAPAPYLVIDLH